MKKIAFLWLFLSCLVFFVSCDLVYPFLFPTVELTVANETGDTVTAFYAKPASAAEWGDSRLSASLMNGASAVLSLEKGVYDFRAAFAAGEPSDTLGVNLGAFEFFTLSLKEEVSP